MYLKKNCIKMCEKLDFRLKIHVKCGIQQDRHITEHKNYRKLIEQERRNPQPPQESLEKSPTSFENQILFSKYFRIITEIDNKISAACKLCTDTRIVKGDAGALLSFIGHLQVFILSKNRDFLNSQFFKFSTIRPKLRQILNLIEKLIDSFKNRNFMVANSKNTPPN